MNGEEALNRILSLACPTQMRDDGVGEYIIELHCVLIKVVAKPMGRIIVNDEYVYTTFDVDSVEVITEE